MAFARAVARLAGLESSMRDRSESSKQPPRDPERGLVAQEPVEGSDGNAATRERKRAVTDQIADSGWGSASVLRDARTERLHSRADELLSGSSCPTELQPGATIGQYQLIRELGRGGMGAVYLARDLRLGRRVAIKFMVHESAPLVERFQAEARATALCEHENIIVIHDVGVHESQSYMVLEYIKGTTLRAWIEERWQPEPMAKPPGEQTSAATAPGTRVSQSRAAELMIPVARALVHAHQQGLIHRDLKPENIMLTNSGNTKVLDFGIAKTVPTSLDDREREPSISMPQGTVVHTMAGALVGTMAYMSPEQWHGQELDGRSDLWAVGVMLWELCTGRHPLAPVTPERLTEVRDWRVPMPSMADSHPGLQPIADVVDRCLRKPVAERFASAAALLRELEAVASVDTRDASDPRRFDNPYVALAAFQQEDAARFFGRDREIARLVGQLRNHRLVTVAGPSGAGKSSLVRAGLIPALRRSGQRWEAFTIRPGRKPIAALVNILLELGSRIDLGDAEESTAREAIADKLRREPGYLGARLRAHSQEKRLRLLLVVDQFEELYTLGTPRDLRRTFLACLESVADDASSPLRVVLTVRSDFFDRVTEDRAFAEDVTEALSFLAPMRREDLQQALTRPLQATGFHFESGALLDSMLDSLLATRSPLPLLQFTAARLWENRDRDRQLITEASYQALGGVGGALAGHADEVLAGMSASDQRLARIVLTALVSEERTRAIVGLAELRARVPVALDGSVESCVQRLAQARLVLIETDGDGAAAVELSHESLIERWPTLVRWLAEERDVAEFHRRLKSAARQWQENGRTDDLLWRGRAARGADRWHERGDAAVDGLAPRERDFLGAVSALAARTRRRRRRLAIAVFAVVCAVAIVVSLLAVRADRSAREARATCGKPPRAAGCRPPESDR